MLCSININMETDKNKNKKYDITTENGTYIFECLLRHSSIMHIIDNDIINKYITQTDGYTIGLNIPKIVLEIIILITRNIEFKSILKRVLKMNKYTESDIISVMEHFYTYIIQKIPFEFNSSESYHIYNTCVNLAIMKINYSEYSGLLCLKKNQKNYNKIL